MYRIIWRANILTKKNFTKSLSTSQLALKSFQELKDKNSEGLAFTQIGRIYLDTEKYKQAIPYFLKSNQLIKEEDDPIAIGINYENLGSAYTQIGKYSEGESNLLRAIDIFKKHQSLEHLTKFFEVINLFKINRVPLITQRFTIMKIIE